MLQIQTVTPSSNPLPGAADEAERSPGDGFESLLAGLMGIAPQPAVRPETGRAPDEARLPRFDPEAAATGAAAGDAGGTGSRETDPEGATAPLLRPAATPVEPGAATAAPTTPEAPYGATPSTALPSGADAAVTLPRPPAERPGNAAAPGSPPPLAEQQGRAAAAELPRPLSERPAPRGRADAGKPAAAEAVPSAQRAEARAEAAQRPMLDAAARGPELAARSAPPSPVLLGQTLLGSGLAGGFAQLTLHAEWQEPVDLDVGRSLTSLPGGTQRLDAIAAGAAAGRTAATPPVQQLAAAIERAVGGDVQRLTVQLSPEALGSIEIALEVDAERRLSVAIMAERPETVELLRTEARDLQRLLAQQGIDLRDAGLELGLMGGERREQQSGGKKETSLEVELEPGEVQGLSAPVPGAGSPGPDPVGRTGRLNLSI